MIFLHPSQDGGSFDDSMEIRDNEFFSVEEMANWAKPFQVEGRETLPQQMTFLLAMPRTGSYALSQIFDTPYCKAHHEGCDFQVLAEREEDDLCYSTTNSYALWREAFESGKHYFCCDQSCGTSLLDKALRCREIELLQSRGHLQLNVVVMTRNQPECLISLYEACKEAGIANYMGSNTGKLNATALWKGIDMHRQLIHAILEAHGQEMIQRKVMCLRGCDYDKQVKYHPVMKPYPGFHQGTLEAMAAITGAAGLVLDPNDPRTQGERVNDKASPNPFFPEDHEMMNQIKEKAQIQYKLDPAIFLRNYQEVDRVMTERKKSLMERERKESDQEVLDFFRKLFE